MSDQDKQQKRVELAKRYNVSLPTIRAITAWTKIRADKMTKQSLSPAEARRLIHMRIIGEHLRYCAEVNNTPERTLYELGQIFKKFYSLEEVEVMIKEIEQVGIGNMNIPDNLEDPDVKPGERVNYDNEEKNKSREWWLDHLRESSKHEDKTQIKLVLLPAAECHELDPVIEMGYSPANLRCYNKGDDPTQNALFVRNCQQRGVYDWHLEDMNDVLPKDRTRIHGGNLDFTGEYCGANERVISYLPVPANGKMYFAFNFQKKREGAEITTLYREAYYYVVNAEKRYEIDEARQRTRDVVQTMLDPNSVKTIDARDTALPAMLEEAIGLARQEYWLCKKEMRELVIASEAHPDFDSYDAHQKAKATIEIMTRYEEAMLSTFSKVLAPYLPPEALSTLCLLLMGIARDACFNKTHALKEEIYKYKSLTGSPFISVFLECENIHDEYRGMLKTLRFYLKTLTGYVKGIFVNNPEEVLKKLRTTNERNPEEVGYNGGGRFEIKNRNIHFHGISQNTNTHIAVGQLIWDINKMYKLIIKREYGVTDVDNLIDMKESQQQKNSLWDL